MEPVVQRLSENSRRITMTPAPEALDPVLDFVAQALDLTHLDYISFAGLRVILKAIRPLPKKGLTAAHVPEAVQEVFDITGFSDFLTIV